MKSKPELWKVEVERYRRHLVMPEVGLEGQKRLKASSVLVVGAGGLGTPATTYLAAAGVGRLGIIDFDTIERSNLQRQVLYSESDVGKSKVEVAKAKLEQINPNVAVEAYNDKLDSSNALRILKTYDVVVDSSDNFPARYLVNDACVFLGKPDVYASVSKFDGQASVFYAREGPCYRCLYPEPPPPAEVLSCAAAGVFGVLPGIMGSIQAAETIDLLLGKGSSLLGRLIVFDGAKVKFADFKLQKNPECVVCGSKPTVKELIDYDAFCGLKEKNAPELETTPVALKKWIDEGRRLLLLDVREPLEYQICHIEGSKLIPLGQLKERVRELDKGKPIVAYCHVGIRSAAAVELLSGMGFKSVKNLKGGITAWADQVDPSMPKY
jgi:adenylyltransferase/sulfurtransferase